MSEYTFETAALKAVTIDAVKYNEEGLKNSLTAEVIEQVMPIRFSSYTAPATSNGADDIVIGNGASSNGWTGKNEGNIVIGNGASTSQNRATLVGKSTKAGKLSVAVGCGANANGTSSVSIGFNTAANGQASVSIGGTTMGAVGGTWYEKSANTTKTYSVALGAGALAEADTTVTVGASYFEVVNGETTVREAKTEGTGSITIGAGANTLNTTTTVDGVETTVESSNSVTIGCKASNQGADSVVLGAQATSTMNNSVAIGAGAKVTQPWSVVIGSKAQNTSWNSVVAIGYNARAGHYSTLIGTSIAGDSRCVGIGAGIGVGIKNNSVLIGYGSENLAEFCTGVGTRNSSRGSYSVLMGASATSGVNGSFGIALGSNAKVDDYGATVIRSTAEDGTYTQLYFSGANTPLAKKYFPTAWEQKQDVDPETGDPLFDDDGNPVMVDDLEKPIAGEAMMGFVAKDSAGNVIARGANMLSALFPYYTGEDDDPFQPTGMSFRGGEKPEPIAFHPSDLDMTSEEPVTEPEEYQPLPVYPIVEPETPEINE